MNARIVDTLERATEFAFFLTDGDGVIVSFNRGAERLLGYSAEEVVNRFTPAHFRLGANRSIHRREEATALGRGGGTSTQVLLEHPVEEEAAGTREAIFERQDGTTVPVAVTMIPLCEAVGAPAAHLWIARDISARRHTEKMLGDLEPRWRYALESCGDGIWDWNVQTGEVFFSHRWKAMLGYRDDEIAGDFEEWRKRVHPEDLPRCQRDLRMHFDGYHPDYHNEHRLLAKDGDYRWILARAQVIERGPDRRPLRIIGTHTDVTERRATEERLRQSEQRFRGAFEAGAIGMAMLSIEGHFLEVNDALCRSLGATRARLLGTTVESWTHPDEVSAEHCVLKETLGGTRPGFQAEKRLLHTDGSTVTARVAVSLVRDREKKPLHFVVQVEDVSEARRMEARLRQAEKFEAIGQLAAGIAHEINTPTQFIGDNLHFLDESFAGLVRMAEWFRSAQRASSDRSLALATPPSLDQEDLDFLLEEIPSALRQAQEGVKRIGGIVRAMREFCHPGNKQRAPVDLNEALRMAVTISRSEWKSCCEVRFELDPALRPVRCLPGEINQVLLNLIVNAAQAVGEVASGAASRKGTITVASRQLKGAVELRVADTGGGVPDAIKARIFEPFFTTKEAGKGTGQGLAVAYDVVVRQHGGALTCESVPGAGATFRVRLPEHAEEVS